MKGKSASRGLTNASVGGGQTDARALAQAALARETLGATCQAALDGAVSGLKTDARERNLASELFYGVCRNRIRLDYIMGRFLPKPKALPRGLRDILHIALYTLLYQQKIPHYAAIDSAVERARHSYGRLAGVANGFLRNVQRNLEDVQTASWYGASFSGLSTFYSIPAWIACLWQKAYGPENAQKLLARGNSRPWRGAVWNPDRPILLSGGEPLDWGYCFAPGALPPEADEWRREGRAFFMSPASWHVLARLGIDGWEEPLWDACAGRGGKSAALLCAGARVGLATDISQKRLAGLPGVCAGLGLPAPETALYDASRGLSWKGNILLDVPCSGLGVLARRPDMARKRTPADLPGMYRQQRALLEGAAESLKAGGKLAYVTCTLNPAENEVAVREFLRGRPNFKLLAEWQTPHEHPWLDGMYGAALLKT